MRLASWWEPRGRAGWPWPSRWELGALCAQGGGEPRASGARAAPGPGLLGGWRSTSGLQPAGGPLGSLSCARSRGPAGARRERPSGGGEWVARGRPRAAANTRRRWGEHAWGASQQVRCLPSARGARTCGGRDLAYLGLALGEDPTLQMIGVGRRGGHLKFRPSLGVQECVSAAWKGFSLARQDSYCSPCPPPSA